MKRIILVTAVAVLIGAAAAYGNHERHLSPEFHAQLIQLQKSTDAEQAEQKRRMDEYLQRQEVTNDRLEVEGARLDVQLAEIKGQNPAAALNKLQIAEQKLSTSEMVVGVENDSDAISNALGAGQPSSAVVYAALPSHANTFRDRLVLKHLKSAEAMSTELSACDEKTQADHCRAMSTQLQRDVDYFNAAVDNKY